MLPAVKGLGGPNYELILLWEVRAKNWFADSNFLAFLLSGFMHRVPMDHVRLTQALIERGMLCNPEQQKASTGYYVALGCSDLKKLTHNNSLESFST